MEIINFAAQTSQGPFLNLNEDAFEYDLDSEFFTVLDGFGGAGCGDVTVKELASNLKKFYTNFIFDPNSTLPFYYSPRYLPEGNAIINAALNSHQKIFEANTNKDLSSRSGASGIVGSKVESVLSLLSVGNCRAYLFRKGKTLPIFTEDSFKYLSHDLFETHLKNIPLSGFGLFPDLHYQVKELRVAKDDKVLLLTDGVYGRISDEELLSTISKFSLNINHKIHELFDLSNSRGNLDNQTCMILEF